LHKPTEYQTFVHYLGADAFCTNFVIGTFFLRFGITQETKDFWTIQLFIFNVKLTIIIPFRLKQLPASTPLILTAYTGRAYNNNQQDEYATIKTNF
jgi:hypothetical protein